MKKHIKLAAVIVVINIITFPIMRHFAYLERGQPAFGGEHLLFIFGFMVAFAFLIQGLQSTPQKRHKKSRARWGTR